MRDKYNLIDTHEKIKQLDEILINPDGTAKHSFISFDTETNGLKLHRTVVVGFSISFDRFTGYYVPLLTWKPDLSSLKTKTIKGEKYQVYEHGNLYCPWTNEDFEEFVTPDEFQTAQRLPWVPALLKRWLLGSNLYTWNGPFDRNQTLINTGVDIKNNIILDGSLLVHILDENHPSALKENLGKYQRELGINAHAHLAMEKNELNKSIIQNGGKSGMVWRADLMPQMKYGCADTFYTQGICEEATKRFVETFGEKMVPWLMEKEVMPVCKEVVCDMKGKGVYVDVNHFETLNAQNKQKMMNLEDKIIDMLNERNLLDDFTMGKSIDEEISKQALIKKIIELEGLTMPKNPKTGKDSIAKGVVGKEYEANPHWIWGYILGEDEIKYSDQQIKDVKQKMYEEKIGRRYHFNINSPYHWRWVLCTKMGTSQKDLPQTDAATPDNPIASMGADVLREYFLGKDGYEFIKPLLVWRKLEKLQSSYILPALNLNKDGWLYMDMKQNGTTSGRFSCSGGFNLQTLPRADDEDEALNECPHCGAVAYNKDKSLTGDISWREDIECIADRICHKCGKEEQNIPRPSAIKKGFIAPPGYKIVNADYSSLEPRCFAVMSGEEGIKDVYRKGLDLYSQAYCIIFDDKNQYSADPEAPNYLKKVAKHLRTWIKPIVLGIPYGSGDAQVASMIGAKKLIIDKATGKEIEIPDIQEGKRVRDLYLATFDKLQGYMDQQELMAVNFGYVETIVGRRRHLKYAKGINDVLKKYNVHYEDLVHASKRFLTKKEAKYVSKRGVSVVLTEQMLEEIKENLGVKKENYSKNGYWAYVRALMKADLNNAKNNPIQGLAGHITNKGMLKTTRLYKENGIDGWVCLQVHDEISAYVREDQAELGAQLLKQGMEDNEFTRLLDIPMIAEPMIADNLKEAK